MQGLQLLPCAVRRNSSFQQQSRHLLVAVEAGSMQGRARSHTGCRRIFQEALDHQSGTNPRRMMKNLSRGGLSAHICVLRLLPSLLQAQLCAQ